MLVERDKTEIEEQVDWCRDRRGQPTNRWPAMSYEEGVERALRWVLGEEEEPPIEDDPDPFGDDTDDDDD